jgi:hypothetical protein
MAVFRERRRTPRAALVAGGLILAAIVIGAVLALRPATSVDPRAGAQAQAQEAAQGLELVTIEYPKVLRGEPSGALGALQRASAAFAAARSDLSTIDAPAVAQIAAALAALDEKVAARAPAAEVIALADTARAELLALSTQ